MPRHRLTDAMPSGLRWSQPKSGVVFVAPNGEVIHVDRGPIGHVGRRVDTGYAWKTADGDE